MTTSPADFEHVKQALEARGFRPAEARVAMEPTSTVALAGDEAEAALRLADALEDRDDVQAVYANFDISEEAMAAIAGA